jgi:hypothetical protein
MTWLNSCARGAVLGVVVALTAVIASAGPVQAQDAKQDSKQDSKPVKKMVFGARQLEKDEGDGAVLCRWTVYLTVQTQTAACKLARKPADDAIDAAIVAMDAFILTNSSLEPTRAMLDDFKRRTAASLQRSVSEGYLQKICQHRDLDKLRSTSPDQIKASTEALLATPREPVMSPCS